MDIKKTGKKNISRTYRQSNTNTKTNISSHYTEKNNKYNMDDFLNIKNTSQIIKKESFKNIKLKNYNINKADKSKALSKKKLYIDFNNSNLDNSLYNINNILNIRKSSQYPKNKNTNIIQHKRFTLKRTLKKKLKENNLTKNDINTNNIIYNDIIKKSSLNTKQITSKNLQRNRKNQSEIKSRKNKQMTVDILNNNKKIKNKNEKKDKLRGSNIPHDKKNVYENLNIDVDIKEIKDEDEIRNKVLRHNTTVFNFEKNNFRFDEIKKENNNNIYNKVQINSNNEHDLDKFFKQNNNNDNNSINNELFRFSNISKINNNDLFYLNNNLIFNNFTENRISNGFTNQKIEKIEGNESHELIEFDEKLLDESVYNEEKQKQKEKNISENKEEQKVSMPCLNCDKLINIDEIDEHSNKCFNIKKNNNINERINSDYINIIENKLKNILEYIEKIEKNDINNSKLIQDLKSFVKEILSIKEINSFSLEILSTINNKINNLMEKYINDANHFTLLSRIKILLEEKIKFFSKENKNKKSMGIGDGNRKDKNFGENSVEENISESETMEFFDLKKMEKILDEKELKNQNLDKLINEAKNKRLFLMEVLKVKFQKIKENKNEDLISPEMIWKEALKKNIQMNNWGKFIFNELNNPNKYLKMIQKKNNIYQKRK